MNYLSLFFACILPGLLFSQQITIDQNDMPSPASDTIRVSLTSTLSQDVALTGTNYTWDFTNLIPVSQRVDTFVSVLSTLVTYNIVFNNFLDPVHKATVATPNPNSPSFVSQVQITESYDFFKASSSAYTKVGFGAKINGIPAPVKYNDPELFFSFPLNYGNTDSSETFYGMTVPGFGYYGQRIIHKNDVDGWGTLSTPYGTFPTVRVKSVITTTDTVFLDSLGFGFNIPRPTETQYKWLGKNQSIPLLQINKTTMMTSVIYRDSVRIFPTNIALQNESSFTKLSLFPNPVSDYFTLQFDTPVTENIRISITDVAGTYKKIIYDDLAGKGKTSLLFSRSDLDLSTGVYQVKIESTSGSICKKLVVLQ